MKLLRSKSIQPSSRSGFVATLVMWAITTALTELTRPKPDIENAKPVGLGEFSFPTATEGRYVPMVWGTVLVEGPNVVWYGDLRQRAITEKIKTGLFSSMTVIRGFRYDVGIQFAICRDIGLDGGTKLLGMWIGDDNVMTGSIVHNGTFTVDDEELFGGDDLGNGGFTGTFRFADGRKTQSASTYLSAFQLEGGDTPAYRGTVTIAPDVDPFYVGNSTSIKAVKWEVQRIPNGLGLSGNGSVNTLDANPMNVLFELYTDKLDGMGFSASDIDTANWTTAANTLETEGNGFSYIQDTPIETEDLVRLIEEQIDGVVYFDQSVAKFRVKLARSDYTLGDLALLDESSIDTLDSFSRGSWENTTNRVRVQFTQRSDNYKTTFAPAIDGANMLLQNGVTISGDYNFPGVKEEALANDLAWRQLRLLSYPLARVTATVGRTLHDHIVGGAVRFSWAALEIVDMPMRIIRINRGTISNGKIQVELVQDVFYYLGGSFAPSPLTGWTPPADTLIAFPTGNQIAMEAPRAIVMRDVDSAELPNRLLVFARKQSVEAMFKIRERHASGSPSGDYKEVGNCIEFAKLGQLASTLSAGSAYPLTSLILAPNDDTAAIIEAHFFDESATTIGSGLVNLIVIDPGGTSEEFMLVSSAEPNASNVQLNDVYRGVLDTAQRDHSSGVDVWMVLSALSTVAIPETDNVDIKLIPKSFNAELAEGDATAISITMDKRFRRPYPPSELFIIADDWPTTASLEGTGSGGEDYHLDLSVTRRDFNVADEVQALLWDAETIDSNYPAERTSTHEVDVRSDPQGTNTLLFSQEWTGQATDIDRLQILRDTSGALPTRLRFVIRARHDEAGEILDSRHDLSWDFDVTSALTGQFEFGALDTNVVSSTYTATVAGTYSFTLSSTFTVGDVEYRLNGGSWTTLISAASTAGSIVGVSVSDTIEIRHTSTDTSALKHLDMVAAGAGQDGFCILYT